MFSVRDNLTVDKLSRSNYLYGFRTEQGISGVFRNLGESYSFPGISVSWFLELLISEMDNSYIFFEPISKGLI